MVIIVEKTSNWSLLLMYMVFLTISGISWYLFHSSRYEKRVWFAMGSSAIISTLFTIGVRPTLFLMGFFQVCMSFKDCSHSFCLGCN